MAPNCRAMGSACAGCRPGTCPYRVPVERDQRLHEDVVREYLFGVQNEHRRNELFRALDALVAERDLAIAAAQEQRRLREEAERLHRV